MSCEDHTKNFAKMSRYPSKSKLYKTLMYKSKVSTMISSKIFTTRSIKDDPHKALIGKTVPCNNFTSSCLVSLEDSSWFSEDSRLSLVSSFCFSFLLSSPFPFSFSRHSR